MLTGEEGAHRYNRVCFEIREEFDMTLGFFESISFLISEDSQAFHAIPFPSDRQ